MTATRRPSVPRAPSPEKSSSSSSRGSVGRVRSAHAPGTTAAVDAADKWVRAALRALHHDVSDLMDPETHEPNDALFSKIHSQLAEWRTAHTLARDAGVDDSRPHELAKAPPQCVLAKARAWFIRHVNEARAVHHKPEVDDKWARKLGGVRADARAVNAETRNAKAADGTLYHHKHDLAPTYFEMTGMCCVGFTGDARVDVDVLSACEAGAAVALYLPTGARGSELRKMYLQSIGYEDLDMESQGLSFECLKLMAFETKTRAYHLNQVLASSNPWRCGIGALGVTLLVRVVQHGPPPFGMQRDATSWKLLSTGEGKAFDRRLQSVFDVAGVHRQLGDPLTYLGRHFGTRVLQHQGGTAEGGAARRGHSNGTASFHYTECPLPDLLRLAGNDAGTPFVPAHHQRSLWPHVDAVLVHLFPSVGVELAAVEARLKELDTSKTSQQALRARTDEHLLDRRRMLQGLRFACRTALLCLVARPRTWKKWAIIEAAPTLWQRHATVGDVRVIPTLFGGKPDAVHAMNALAGHVRRCEEAELASRRLSTEQAVSTKVVAALQEQSDRQHAREAAHAAQQQAFLERIAQRLEGATTAGGKAGAGGGIRDLLPDPADVATSVAAAEAAVAPSTHAEDAAPTVPALATVRTKRKREEQTVVKYVTSHATIADALEYARTTLVPLEKAQGAAWRITKKDDGREDKSIDRQWRFYRLLAIAVGTTSVEAVQARCDALPSMTKLFQVLDKEQKAMTTADVQAAAACVLGLA